MLHLPCYPPIALTECAPTTHAACIKCEEIKGDTPLEITMENHMKKSLFALAVAGAFVAPAAMAETSNVNVYGAVNMSLESISRGNTAAASGASGLNVSSNVSKLGIKGSEDLGGGLSAIWQIEQQINIDNSGTAASASSGSTFATRDSFLGLKSEDMGTILLGKHDTPYKLATRGLDLFADTIADNRSLMGKTGKGASSHDLRTGDTLAYISPAMSGFTVAIAYVAGAETTTNSAQTQKGAAWSMAGMYNAGPFNASLAYQALDFGSLGTGTLAQPTGLTAGDKLKAWRIGGGYTMDAIQLNAAYEQTSYTPILGGVDTMKQNNYYLAGKYSFGNDAVKLAYAHAGEVGSTAATQANSQASQVSLGYDHNLSKRTTVYALYTKISNNANSSYGFSSGGSTADAANLGNNASPSAFALGMKHAF